MPEKKNRLLTIGISSIFFGLLLPLASLGVEVLVYKFAPNSFWFEYHLIQPAQDEFPMDEHPTFISTSEVNQAVFMEWNDILRCDLKDGKGYRFFSSYTSENSRVEKKEMSSSAWTYGSDIPTVEATCYLESNISITLPFGIKRTQKIIGKKFMFT